MVFSDLKLFDLKAIVCFVSRFFWSLQKFIFVFGNLWTKINKNLEQIRTIWFHSKVLE